MTSGTRMTGREPELEPLNGQQPPALSMASADRCPNCGAGMTPDQRYCLECGARRGKPRFSVGQKPAVAAVPVDDRREPRFSSGATLLTGLAILLIALGVGVMIGKGGNAANAGKPSYNITVNGGGGGSSGSSGTSGGTGSSGTGSSGTSRSKPSSSKSSGSPTASLSGDNGPKVNQASLHTKAQRKAAVKKIVSTKVKLNNGKTLAPATQKIGGKCSSSEVGCTDGKFTGTFFGGG